MQRLEQLFEEHGDNTLIIPEYGYENETYPGNIQPGYYCRKAVLELINRHKNDPDAVQFLADMLEL